VIGPGLKVGIEDVDDLITDIDRALDAAVATPKNCPDTHVAAK